MAQGATPNSSKIRLTVDQCTQTVFVPHSRSGMGTSHLCCTSALWAGGSARLLGVSCWRRFQLFFRYLRLTNLSMARLLSCGGRGNGGLLNPIASTFRMCSSKDLAKSPRSSSVRSSSVSFPGASLGWRLTSLSSSVSPSVGASGLSWSEPTTVTSSATVTVSNCGGLTHARGPGEVD